MRNFDKIGLTDFLYNNPGMVFISLSASRIVLEGNYHLCAYHDKSGNVDADYKLRIEIPSSFPRDIPIVREISYKIPRDRKHHINIDPISYTDSLCLGSRIKILQKISEKPTITGFIEKCVVPQLCANEKGAFIFGELAHYADGIFDDYQDIFNVSTDRQVINILLCLSKKKRIANKWSCPCECGGQRLGKCKVHNKINQIRRLASRNSFKLEYISLKKEKKNMYL